MNQANAATGFENVGIMWKTVSEDCNLACNYCYYSTCGGKPHGKANHIQPDLLEKVISEYLGRSRWMASFSWQGGEPLLAGFDFFEEVVRLQKKYAPANMRVANSLQTNGTLITEDFAQLFHDNDFLLGVSIDGPRGIHDARRIDWRGEGSYDRIMKRIQHLRNYEVDFNVLTVIHKQNVNKVDELFDFYEEQDFKYLQFIPCMLFQSQKTNQPGDYEITPGEFGDFLCRVFDRWYNDGNPDISVRFFDNLLSMYAHREAELCSFKKQCGKVLILEPNGDAYPCDFYIDEEWKMGNLGSTSLNEILASPIYDKFAKLKPALPYACTKCEWLHLCHGGCPRNRRWFNDFQQSHPDYFCQSYRQVYAYAHQRLLKLSNSVRANLFAQGIQDIYHGKLPERNDLCACGSRKKYKACCMPNH